MRVAVLEKSGRYVAGVFSPKGLYATDLPQRSEKDAIEQVKGAELERDDREQYLSVLDAIFSVADGREIDFNRVNLDLTGLTEKQRIVVEKLMEVSRGQTITYGELARRAGMPGAARFVGSVMANNRLAPIVPCHRVVGTKGLTGYAGGLELKRELLRREGSYKEALE
jgi:methylated-DNA-[protein]-cysteine S-methyltransferase